MPQRLDWYFSRYQSDSLEQNFFFRDEKAKRTWKYLQRFAKAMLWCRRLPLVRQLLNWIVHLELLDFELSAG